jgi:hypothetical protein
VRVCLAAARTVEFSKKMKWIYAGLALAAVSLIGGLAAIVAGYRQVIARYMAGPPAQTPPHLTTRADNTSS